MKKVSFLLVLFWSVASVYGQEKYYSLQECDNDPLSYIEKNYQDNKEKYIGKKAGLFFDEYELKVDRFFPGPVYPDSITKPMEKTESLHFKTHSNNYIYSVMLYFAPPYLSYREALDLEGDYEPDWGPKFYEFYKDAIIREIYILKENAE